MEKISIIIPAIRPADAKRCIKSIHDKGGLPESQYEILTEIDTERIGCPKMVKRLVGNAKHDLVCFLGDDTEVKQDCLKLALEEMRSFPDGWGLVGLADGTGRELPTHWLASKKLLPSLDGEFFHTGYGHCFCDKELMDIATDLKRFKASNVAKIKHNHPMVTGAKTDADYKRVYGSEFQKIDLKLYRKRKFARIGHTLGIGLPIINETVSKQLFLSFLQIEKPDYTLFIPRFPHGQMAISHDALRNSLIEQAMGCSHLIMMDTDQLYPADTIMKLIKHAEDGYDVVGTPVHRSWPPYDVIMYRGRLNGYVHVSEKECYSGDMVEVDATGCGCIMYNMDMFIDMKSPWFESKKSIASGHTIGEDIGMCWRLRNAGYRIFVDTSIEIIHTHMAPITRQTYELHKRTSGQKIEQVETECYTDFENKTTDDIFSETNIGCGSDK